MKFLLDVCASSHSLHTLLTNLGHDVRLVVESDPRSSDETILSLAYQEGRLVITLDKDFGDWCLFSVAPMPVLSDFLICRFRSRWRQCRNFCPATGLGSHQEP